MGLFRKSSLVLASAWSLSGCVRPTTPKWECFAWAKIDERQYVCDDGAYIAWWRGARFKLVPLED
jgi:hypothetical protein